MFFLELELLLAIVGLETVRSVENLICLLELSLTFLLLQSGVLCVLSKTIFLLFTILVLSSFIGGLASFSSE